MAAKKTDMKTNRLIGKGWFAAASFGILVIALTGCAKKANHETQEGKTGAQSSTEDQADTHSTAEHLPSISQGYAKAVSPNLLECDVAGWRVTAQGKITSTDGKTWTVPSEVNYLKGPKAVDLYNECNEVTLSSAAALDLSAAPVEIIDEDGETITAYFFADNYAELYINGHLVAVDPVPYWPFNTSMVRFKVKRPFTIAARLVDWEENLGLGSEVMHGVPFHTGDGGFVAVFKNEAGETIAKTDDTWRTQVFYMSPIADPSRIEVNGRSRNSDACEAPSKENAEKAYEEFAEASRSTAIDSRNGILTEVLGQLLGQGKQPKSKLVCFPKETKYTRQDSNLQPSVPKTDILSS